MKWIFVASGIVLGILGTAVGIIWHDKTWCVQLAGFAYIAGLVLGALAIFYETHKSIRILEDQFDTTRRSIQQAVDSVEHSADAVSQTVAQMGNNMSSANNTVASLLSLSEGDRRRIDLEMRIFNPTAFDRYVKSTGLRKYIEMKASEFEGIIKNIRRGIIEVPGDDRHIDSFLLDHAKSSLHAISSGDVDVKFWTSDVGANYQNLNIQRAKKPYGNGRPGSRPVIPISRLFICSSEHVRQLASKIIEQINGGVIVHIMNINALRDAPALRNIDVAIFDYDNEPVASLTQLNKIELYIEQERVDYYKGIFDMLTNDDRSDCFHPRNAEEFYSICKNQFNVDIRGSSGARGQSDAMSDRNASLEQVQS